MDLGNVKNFLHDLDLLNKNVLGASIGIIHEGNVHSVCSGQARFDPAESMSSRHLLQCASLSKTVGTAVAIEFLKSRGIDLASTRVNQLLAQLNSNWRIEAAVDGSSTLPPESTDDVTLPMLVNHTALGMHYVYGFPLA